MNNQKIQLAVIVSDCSASTVGGDAQRLVKIFDIPDELAEFIKKSMSTCTTVSFAIHWKEFSENFKFPNVSCSNCGGEFGPGDHGFSHCENHQGKRRIG